VTLILAEVLFWMEKNNPNKNEGKYAFTIKRKCENLIESSLIIGIVFLGIYTAQTYTKQMTDILIGAAIVIGLAGISLALLYGYIWLNSQKYNSWIAQQKARNTRKRKREK
jgi:hypothetical protein